MVGCQAGKGPSWAWATGCDGGGGHPPPSLPPSHLLPLGLHLPSAMLYGWARFSPWKAGGSV